MTRIIHKVCHCVVKHMTMGCLWCETCKREVDATECYAEVVND